MRLSERGIMPKEIINHQPEDRTAVEVSVHWSGTAEYAQLAFGFDVAWMIEYLTDLQGNDLNIVRTQVFTDPLPRSEMQTLIRSAKRARNAVYGADE